ncbi:MAG: class B sortase [Clostridia bacterium]|nr:class B sortase [Clostridia bacterium]MBR5379544.1 class B sortase [Clostridia bacterium]
MARTGLRFLNKLVSVLVSIVLLVTVLYAGFALWDNHQIYHAAESVFDEMKEIKERMAAEAKAAEMARIAAERAAEKAEKKAAEEAEQKAAEEALAAARAKAEASFTSYGAPFEELKAINPDVNGWLTMPGTAIDYPLVQGETNNSYINTDVYGEFALAGSIFLDSRNDDYYTDPYSLLYGHNMSKHRMFSDVNLYKDEAFFNENTTGELYLSDRLHNLTTLSCIVTNAGDSLIMNPVTWRKLDVTKYVESVQTNAIYVNEEGVEALQKLIDSGEQPHILALSTCSNEFTDARTVLLTLID